MSMKSRLHNQRGQFMIEAILLMSLLVFGFVALTRSLRESNIIPNIVTESWDKVAGMSEVGVWEAPTSAAKKKHPNTFNRFYTPLD